MESDAVAIGVTDSAIRLEVELDLVLDDSLELILGAHAISAVPSS